MAGEKSRSSCVKGSIPDIATAMGNPWRFRIFQHVGFGTSSPSRFVKDVGGEISNISRHYRQLAGWGYLELMELKSGEDRRGGVEHVYRATPLGVAAICDVMLMESVLTGRCANQLHALKIVGPIDLDAQGVGELADAFADIRERLPALEVTAERAMEDSGEQPIRGLVGFVTAPASAPVDSI